MTTNSDPSMITLVDVQKHLGIQADGVWGKDTLAAVAKALNITKEVFDRVAFQDRYINLKAGALGPDDISRAAATLGVSEAHIRMLRTVESNGKSFDNRGRPVILFEPHKFWALTNGAYGNTSFSYKRWGDKPYPSSADGRWEQLVDAAACNEEAALQSASWGLFQIMGFNWRLCKYTSVFDMVERMTMSEGEQLDACVRFILGTGLDRALGRCKAGDPGSCKDFAAGYNGSGYMANNYHVKMAGALK